MGVGYPLDLVVCVALGADMYVQYISINKINSVFMLAHSYSFDF
jgi:queuine/archaeosine tRNA-ribosyltransferase